MPVPYRVVAVALIGLVFSLFVVARAAVYAGDATQDAALLVTFVAWVIVVIIVELRYRFMEPNTPNKEVRDVRLE